MSLSNSPQSDSRFAPTDRLAELIEAKRRVLTVLRTLAQGQEAAVEAGEYNRLLKMLASKQALLGELTRIQSALEPYRDENPDARQWRTPEERARCRAASEECAALLEEIMRSEKRTEGQLVQRRDNAAERLANWHSCAEAQHAYGAESPPVPSSVDVSS